MVRRVLIRLTCAMALVGCQHHPEHLRPIAGGPTPPPVNENTYRLDGANITDPVTGTFSVSDTSTSRVLTKDFLEKLPTGRSYQSAVGLSAGVTGSGARPKPTAPTRPAPSPPAPAAAAPLDRVTPPPPTLPAPTDRLVHYEGVASLRVTRPTDALEAAEAIALDHGGRVDRLGGSTIVLRVPIAAFQQAWTDCLALGDLIDQVVRADDVTEQFVALDLRVKTLTHTRDRLVELLAKATREQEKLALLAEITRVSEALDGVLTQRRTLADLAAFSRITLHMVPRKAYTGHRQPQLAGMAWTAHLSPFRRAVFYDDKRIALPVPAGFVSLSDTGPFRAESPEGAVLWTTRLRNDPVGDGAFWVEAIRRQVADSFDEAPALTLGAWTCLVLDEAGADAPYRWQVCVRPDGRHLEVGQVYYPSPEQVDRYEARVAGAFRVSNPVSGSPITLRSASPTDGGPPWLAGSSLSSCCSSAPAPRSPRPTPPPRSAAATEAAAAATERSP